MTLLEMYKEMENNNIDIYYFPMETVTALSLPDGSVAIDTDKIENSTEEITIVAHEWGHIETGTFYNQHSPLCVREKAEYKAEKWAIKKLIPFDELSEALCSGIIEHWELAEYFNVTDKFMCEALDFYKDKIMFMNNIA